MEYRRWYYVARRLSRSAAEAEDLLHDSLLAAVVVGRQALSTDADCRWFSGTLIHLSAMRARSDIRRRRREGQAAPTPEVTVQVVDREPLPSAVQRLPRGVRLVMILAIHGLGRVEIRQALGISDVALRQRLTALRRCLDGLPAGVASDLCTFSRLPRTDHHDLGLIRRALIKAMQRLFPQAAETGSGRTAAVGFPDPDGHLFIVPLFTAPSGTEMVKGGATSTSQKSLRRQPSREPT